MKASKFMAIVMMACTILAVGCKKSGGTEEPEIKIEPEIKEETENQEPEIPSDQQ